MWLLYRKIWWFYRRISCLALASSNTEIMEEFHLETTTVFEYQNQKAVVLPYQFTLFSSMAGLPLNSYCKNLKFMHCFMHGN